MEACWCIRDCIPLRRGPYASGTATFGDFLHTTGYSGMHFIVERRSSENPITEGATQRQNIHWFDERKCVFLQHFLYFYTYVHCLNPTQVTEITKSYAAVAHSPRKNTRQMVADEADMENMSTALRPIGTFTSTARPQGYGYALPTRRDKRCNRGVIYSAQFKTMDFCLHVAYLMLQVQRELVHY